MPRFCYRLVLVLLSVVALTSWGAEDEPAPSAPRSAVMIEIKDAIGPATSDFFVRSLAEAKSRGAPLFIVQMDTPGGLDSAMRDMIQAIIASPVPVVMYVAPSGARAASAGTYLLYASHVAAMAPATNLGAATPVQIGGSPPPSTPEPKSGDKEGEKDSEEAPASELPGTASER